MDKVNVNVTFAGGTVTIVDNEIKLGSSACDSGIGQDLKPVKHSDFKGKNFVK